MCDSCHKAKILTLLIAERTRESLLKTANNFKQSIRGLTDARASQLAKTLFATVLHNS